MQRSPCLRFPRVAAAGLSVVLGVAGCGNPGLPLPPSLMLPQPVNDLRVSRTGDTVTLLWTMPSRSTDRVPLHGDVPVAICRVEENGACRRPLGLLKEAGKSAAFSETLPPEWRSGPARLLRYEVRLGNRRRMDAGPSNPAWTVAGAAPPAIRSASAEATAEGIAVHWTGAPPQDTPPDGAKLLVRLQRERVSEPGESAKPDKAEQAQGVPQPVQQVLEAAQHAGPGATGWSPGETVDSGALLNRSYRYTVQLVEQLTLDGHVLEVDGEPARTPLVDARDRFAPATPGDLAAVSNADGGTIDLSWNADAEADLAGYFVYRRLESDGGPPVRVSGAGPLPGTSWSDPHPVKGVRYSYSVSAVDRSGNESARSGETVEALPE